MTARRHGFGQGAIYVWSMPADPPDPMAQGTHGMDAMDATCHGVVEGDAQMLSRLTDLTGEEAYRLIHPFTEEDRTTIQCGREFACISAFGRLLFVVNRRELRGLCHPERN